MSWSRDDDGGLDYRDDDGGLDFCDDDGGLDYRDDDGGLDYRDDNGGLGYRHDDGGLGYRVFLEREFIVCNSRHTHLICIIQMPGNVFIRTEANACVSVRTSLFERWEQAICSDIGLS